MKNFKRILAIVLVVMMVVPMMTTGLSAATAANVYVYSNTGTEFAGGNWKAFVTCDFSGAYGPDFAVYDLNGLTTVDSEGQICLYNTIQKDFAGTPFVTPGARNVLQSTNTTAIDDLFMQVGFIPSGNNGAYPLNLSYAFSETQLQGALTVNSYTVENGFAVEDDGMVKDGLVINMYRTSVPANGDASYETIAAFVMENGKIVSSQSFDIDNQGKDFGLAVGHSHRTFFTFDDAGILTYHVEDTYSADGAYINQTYTFDELDMSTINATEKMYYLSVGSGDYWNVAGSAGVNLNLARIGTVIDDGDGTFSVDGETKNFADWTGFGVASCEHVWGEYVEVTAPTCTATGLAEAACQNGCGTTDTKTIPANGHDWSDWANTVDPTCTDAGVRERSCGSCGETQTDAAAATGHAWGDWYTTVDPDCANDGMEQRDCPTCGSYEENILPALGHAWVWDTLPTDSVNGARHCDVCDAVESDLAYDVSYYWDIASTNKVGDIDAGYADYNDEYGILVDGMIELQDMSYAYAGPYNKNTMLKATSEFKSSLAGFSVTVDTLEDNYIDSALEQEYPTTVSFMWTNLQDQYDDKAEYSVNANYGNLGVASSIEASRFGHIWGTYVAGEYSLNVVLSDYCVFWGTTTYGEPDDGEYDWLYYTVVSEGNYWTTKMIQLTPAVSAYEPITLTMFTEYNETSGKVGVYCDINGNLFELAEAAGSQLNGQDYYFSVATYAEGANQATASFQITDVCYEAPATFAGYKHEHSYYYDVEATCETDGFSMCYECAEVVSTTPAAGHNYGSEFVCINCGEYAGAYIEGGEAYADLHAAINAAESLDKIVLLAKQEKGPYTVSAQKNIDIDLNGFNIRNTDGDALIVDNATVRIYGTDGGTVRSSNGIAIVLKNGFVDIMDAITVRCSAEDGYNVFSLDETSSATIYALGGRYYKNPVVAGATLADGLAIEEISSTNFTVIEAPVEPETKDYVITFDADGGVMPEGALTELPINYGENYKEAAGYDYPVPTLEGYVFAGWFLEAYSFVLTEGDWNGGYYALNASCELIALYEEAPAPAEVEVTAELNTITVTNINDGVKDIFVAAGEQSVYADVKANMLYHLYATSHKVVDGTWAYNVSENGIYTVLIRYNDGTVEAKYFVVNCDDGKVADCVQDGATVTFNNLDDLYVLRYVAGEYDSSAAIKRAPGVVNVSPKYDADKLAGNSFSVTLEPGTYSFVTQFNDGNYVYYIITVEAPVVAKDYTITFDPDGGVMPEGALLELPINYGECYKDAAGYDYPVPTLEGYTFGGWLLEAYGFVLTEGDWNGGYYALNADCELIAIYNEA